MSWNWKWITVPVAIVAVVTLLTGLIGAALPRQYQVTASATYHASPQAVWQTLTDVESYPNWRSDLVNAERLPDRDGLMAWREVSKYGRFVIQAIETTAPTHLVARIVETDAPFEGAWVFELTPTEVSQTKATQLTITEHAEVANPFIRFLVRFVIGRNSTLNTYLKDLGRKLGEEI
jgi:uncharacterized protein YndB with AHSA1/START domain